MLYLPLPAVSLWHEWKPDAQPRTPHILTLGSFSSLIGFVDPHTGILYATHAQGCSWAKCFPPLPPTISTGWPPSCVTNYQLELAPVNTIPLHLVHTTTNWPPRCSQQLSLHTTSPWEQLQLGNLFAVSQPHPLSSAGLGQLQQLSNQAHLYPDMHQTQEH